jgi:sRNA-binding protein
LTYHKSVIAGVARVDLEGNPSGIVTADEAKYSNDKYQTKLKASKNGRFTQNQNE